MPVWPLGRRAGDRREGQDRSVVSHTPLSGLGLPPPTTCISPVVPCSHSCSTTCLVPWCPHHLPPPTALFATRLPHTCHTPPHPAVPQVVCHCHYCTTCRFMHTFLCVRCHWMPAAYHARTRVPHALRVLQKRSTRHTHTCHARLPHHLLHLLFCSACSATTTCRTVLLCLDVLPFAFLPDSPATYTLPPPLFSKGCSYFPYHHHFWLGYILHTFCAHLLRLPAAGYLFHLHFAAFCYLPFADFVCLPPAVTLRTLRLYLPAAAPATTPTVRLPTMPCHLRTLRYYAATCAPRLPPNTHYLRTEHLHLPPLLLGSAFRSVNMLHLPAHAWIHTAHTVCMRGCRSTCRHAGYHHYRVPASSLPAFCSSCLYHTHTHTYYARCCLSSPFYLHHFRTRSLWTLPPFLRFLL